MPLRRAADRALIAGYKAKGRHRDWAEVPARRLAGPLPFVPPPEPPARPDVAEQGQGGRGEELHR